MIQGVYWLYLYFSYYMQLDLCWLWHWQILVDTLVEPPVVLCCVHGHHRNYFINPWTLPFHTAVTHWPTNTCRSCVDKPDSCSAGSLSLRVASLSCFFCCFSFSSIWDAIFSNLVWWQRKSAEDHCWATPLPPVIITVACEEIIPSVAVCGMQRSLIFARGKQQYLINTWKNTIIL